MAKKTKAQKPRTNTRKTGGKNTRSGRARGGAMTLMRRQKAPPAPPTPTELPENLDEVVEVTDVPEHAAPGTW